MTDFMPYNGRHFSISPLSLSHGRCCCIRMRYIALSQTVYSIHGTQTSRWIYKNKNNTQLGHNLSQWLKYIFALLSLSMKSPIGVHCCSHFIAATCTTTCKSFNFFPMSKFIVSLFATSFWICLTVSRCDDMIRFFSFLFQIIDNQSRVFAMQSNFTSV